MSLQRWCQGETLMSLRHHPDGPLMGRAKPHIGGGSKAHVSMMQHKYMNNSNTLAVVTLFTVDVETGAKLREEWRW
jgi:hypothetical protein